jgi:hypothetical protein
MPKQIADKTSVTDPRSKNFFHLIIENLFNQIRLFFQKIKERILPKEETKDSYKKNANRIFVPNFSLLKRIVREKYKQKKHFNQRIKFSRRFHNYKRRGV